MSLPTIGEYKGLEQTADPITNLLDIFSIFEPSEDHQQHVQNKCDHEGNVNGLVLGEVSIAKNEVPVDRRRQNEEATRKCCQMGRKALRLMLICQPSNLR